MVISNTIAGQAGSCAIPIDDAARRVGCGGSDVCELKHSAAHTQIRLK
jgi:hypothetical protein